MRSILPAFLCLLLFAVPALSRGQTSADATRGPAKGALMIVGGGAMSPALVTRFVELAGGPRASLVFIPTANEDAMLRSGDSLVNAFKKLGASVTVLHTRDRAQADTEAFAKPLQTATAVWFGGGRQWRLADAYLGTRVVPELFAVLERGGVIGGSSAGATIQGSYLVRGAVEGNTVMMSPGHEEGFGFLKQSAIDQHWAARKRERDLLPVIEKHPHLLGLGLDEGTAIVVQGDVFEVIGASVVGVYDARSPAWKTAQPWQILKAGQSYDVRNRALVQRP